MAERSNAAVLKTVVLQGTGGSNPSFSANWKNLANSLRGFFFGENESNLFEFGFGEKKKTARQRAVFEVEAPLGIMSAAN